MRWTSSGRGNGLRYWQVGGRGLCLGAGKLEASLSWRTVQGKMPENAARREAAVPSVQPFALAKRDRVHALLAGFLFCNTPLAVKNSANTDQLPVVIAPARS